MITQLSNFFLYEVCEVFLLEYDYIHSQCFLLHKEKNKTKKNLTFFLVRGGGKYLLVVSDRILGTYPSPSNACWKNIRKVCHETQERCASLPLSRVVVVSIHSTFFFMLSICTFLAV